MANGFWLSDAQWKAIEPHLPKNRTGARRVDDRRVLSGIIHRIQDQLRHIVDLKEDGSLWLDQKYFSPAFDEIFSGPPRRRRRSLTSTRWTSRLP